MYKCVEKVVATKICSHVEDNSLRNISLRIKTTSQYRYGIIEGPERCTPSHWQQQQLRDISSILELVAAFDIVDHCNLLHRLKNCFGIVDNALELFRSYLSSRYQKVKVDGAVSSSRELQYNESQKSGVFLVV